MSEVTSQISSFLVLMIVPLNLALFLLGLGIVFYLIRIRRFALLLVLTGALWLGAWSLPITSIKVGSFLEEKYALRSMDDLPMTDAIVVLGGNTGGNRQNWFEPELDGSSTHRRVDTAEALYQLGKAPKIIVSGGANEGDISEARGMESALRHLGVPADAIIREDFSRTTRENALFTQRTMAKHHINSLLVVTSALHMPRAMAVFHHLGIESYAAPNPPQIVLPKDDPDFNPYLPNMRALVASRSIIKECLGYWVYRFRGWV